MFDNKKITNLYRHILFLHGFYIFNLYVSDGSTNALDLMMTIGILLSLVMLDKTGLEVLGLKARKKWPTNMLHCGMTR